MVYIKAKTYYALARNSVLLTILISTWLVSAILYSRYNNKYAAAIKDQAKRTFLYTLGALMALWLGLISGAISGRPLI